MNQAKRAKAELTQANAEHIAVAEAESKADLHVQDAQHACQESQKLHVEVSKEITAKQKNG